MARLGWVALIGMASALALACSHTKTEARPPTLLTDHGAEERTTELRKRLEIASNDVDARMELGRIYLSEDDVESAVGEFRKVLAIDSKHIRARLLLSLAYQRRSAPDLRSASLILWEASQIEPDNAAVHLSLGQIYRQHYKDTAIREFSKAIELSKDPAILVSAHLGLMGIYQYRGESEKAKTEYEAAYSIYPGVEEMIMKAEIESTTPAPQYVVEGESRPSVEERIERLQKRLKEMAQEGDSRNDGESSRTKKER
ncbi:MAG TPA: hypothetical protein VM163_07465 [bacterium]|nr:hypothetical protein [bacterium]